MDENKNQLTVKKMTNVKDIQLSKLKVKFNLNTLDMIIAFIFKDSVLRTRKTLTNIYKLVTNLDDKLYDNPDMSVRLWIIEHVLYAKLFKGLDSREAMIDVVSDEAKTTHPSEVLKEILNNTKISHDESKYLIKKLDDALEFGYVVTVKDVIHELIDKIDGADFKTYKSIQDDLYDIAVSIVNIRRTTSSLSSDQTFSLQEDIFDHVVEDAMQKLLDRNRIFRTGIQRLNVLLAPGYMSKRLYTYLAFPGMGKSTILLKSALDIKRYNKDIKPKDLDKRPAVLFLTLENDVAETIERLYNMAVEGDDIRNYTAKQIKSRLRKEGKLVLTDNDTIDIIIKEYKNRELDTNDLYTIINDLSDDGIEVITLIIDYMKRIRPAERADGDEKKELKNISNELKEIAKTFDIPVNKIAA